MKMELTINGKTEHLYPIFSVMDGQKHYVFTFKDKQPQRRVDKSDKVEFNLHT